MKYIALSGGLGDVLMEMYRGSYAALDAITAPVRVYLSCHNPHAAELFENHPSREYLDVIVDTWNSEMAHRIATGCSPVHGLKPLPPCGEPVRFYPYGEDMAALAEVEGHPLFTGWDKVAVFAPAAGEAERALPVPITESLLSLACGLGWLPVLVGRTYSRWEGDTHTEPFSAFKADDVVNLTDRLSVPGVCRLVQDAGLVVAGHSSVSMLAWLEGKKNVLLYPESVVERHFKHRDNFSFGLDRPETLAILMGTPGIPELVGDFLS